MYSNYYSQVLKVISLNINFFYILLCLLIVHLIYVFIQILLNVAKKLEWQHLL